MYYTQMTTPQQRHLARSRNGRVIHRASCRHARVLWPGADSVTDDELWQVKMELGYRVCKVCNPDWQLKGTYETA